VAARASADENESVDAGFERLFGMPDVDHIVQHDAAVRVNVRDHVVRRAQARDRDRHLVPDAGLEIVLEPVVRLVHDLIDRVRRGIRISGERRLDLAEPLVERFLRPCVQRRERADDAGLALLDDELWIPGDEHRRADHGNPQSLQQRRKRHLRCSVSWRALRRACHTLVP
jgi:hypothetical protein